MKLLTRTNIFFVLITLVVFGFGSVVFLKTLRHITIQDALERLDDEKGKVIAYAKLHNALPANSIILGDSISFSPATAEATEKTCRTKVFNPSEREYEPYEALEFPLQVNGQLYKATIFKPLLESDDLQTAVLQAIAIISLALLAVLFIANLVMSKLLWKSFYSTLEKIRAFNISSNKDLSLPSTSIAEFKELNSVLLTMTGTIASDYRSLKEFTENASHELQTPLAIIRSKLELLIQSGNLSATQMEEAQSIYEAANRLSKLNQALLLLAKIENRQFTDTKNIDFCEVVSHKLELFDELIKHKHIALEKKLGPVYKDMHPILADILVSNLVGNAIKHNKENGTLSVELADNRLIVTNTGEPLAVEPTELFKRFRKASQASDSIGLGLAIVKEICNVYHLAISYTYANGKHIVEVSF